ncbi:MAG: gliding motility-associated C-terminal domain-containing protein, partial [Flavobacteriales bacterium]|nr:gliding motility-associated C-terminal domain-containing protein [Flavobacteriales bacterium]
GGGGGNGWNGSTWGSGAGGGSYNAGTSQVNTSGFQSGNGQVIVSYLSPCSPLYTNGCTFGDFINNFSTSGGTSNISNLGTGCSAGAYGDYTSQTHTSAFGSTVSFSLQSGPTYAQGYSIWVDWDQDNVFGANELMWSSATSTTAAVNGSFAIPFAIPKTSYRMRVRCAYVTIPTDPCTNYAYGEVEEYELVVTSPYCSPTFGTGCAVGDQIENFSTTGGTTNITNNGSGCNGTVADFTSLVHTGAESDTVNFTVQAGPTYPQGFGIWVDLNQNGTFEGTEQLWNSGTWSTAAFTGSFVIPCGSDTGATIMRVVATYNAVPTDPCLSATYGEAEEYTLQLNPDATPPNVNTYAYLTLPLDANGSAVVDTNDIDSATTDGCNFTRSVARSNIPGYETQVQYLGALNGHSYYLTNASLSKTAAQTLASNMGGYLAAITSAAENDFITFLASSPTLPPWIGLSDAVSEGTFVWDNGEPVSYTNWTVGEPNNSGNEDCVQLYTTGTWNDVTCAGSYPAVIEVNDTMAFSDRVFFSCADTGTQVVYLQAIDDRGNAGYDITQVDVSDNTGPVISASNFTLYLDSFGEAYIPDSLLDGTTPSGTFYFTGTNSNQIWEADMDSGLVQILFNSAAAASQGPIGIDYSPALDSLYFAGGNSPEVYRIATDGSGSTYSLPNANAASIYERHEVYVDDANNRIFFTAGDDGIFVGNLDGTGVATNLFAPGTAGEAGMDYDPSTDLIVFSDIQNNRIESMRSDGSEYQILYNAGDGVSNARQVVADGKSGSLFWANRGTGSIMVGTVDGSGTAATLYTGQTGIFGIDYYAPSDMLYWTRFGAGDQIYRAPADGSGTPEIVFNSNYGSIRGLTTKAMFPAGVFVSDNCGVASYSVSTDTFYCANLGSNTITINASDISGNSSSGTVDVNVLDTIVPLALSKDTIVYLDAFGSVVVPSASMDSASYDNCGLTFALSDSAFTCADVGNNLVWFYAIDPSGNVDSTQVTIEVLDTVAPDVVAQNINLWLDATGNALISGVDIDNGSSDACGIASLAVDITSFTCGDVGTPVTVTLTVTDSNGNADSATAVVTVIDTVAPNVIAKNVTVILDSLGSVTIPADSMDNGSSDACGLLLINANDTVFDCSDVGSPVQVVLNVADVNTNFDTAHSYVTVLDQTAPEINTFSTLTVNLDATGLYTLTAAELDSASYDACGITYSLSASNFDCSDHGSTYTITLTGTDPSGNVGTGTTDVTVIDATLPTVTTQNHNAILDASGNASIVVNDINNGSSDNCGIASMSLDITSFSCADVGSPVTVTLTVTDSSGNVDSATAVVTVIDNIAPTIVTKNITVVLDSLTGTAVIANDSADSVSFDACGIASITLDQTSFDCSDAGLTLQLVQTVTDSNGNSDTAHAYVTVLDQAIPALHAYDTLTVYLDVNGQYTLTSAEVDSASFDACGIAYSLDTFNFDCNNHAAPVMVTLTGVDPSGNTSLDSTLVTVLDSLAPNVVTQNITVFLNASGQASITANDVNNGSSDGCGIDSLGIDTSNFDCASWNTPITVTLFAIDVFGNSATNTAIVTVSDNIAPVAAAQVNHTVYLDSNGNGSISGLTVDNGLSTDNCAIETWVLDDSTFTCADVGAAVQIVLTVTDSSGNSDTVHAYITVLDTIAPTILIQNSFVYLDSTGNITIPASLVDLGTWDACSTPVITIDSTTFDCSYHGDTITTWFYATDVNGNADSQLVDLYVLDTIAPEVLTQDLTVYLDSLGDASITEAMIDNGSWDSCGVASYALDTTDFNCSDVGSNTVTLSVTDIYGNTGSATAIITVVDTVAPEVLLQAVTLYIDTFGNALLTPQMADSGSNDACGIASFALSDSIFDCSDQGMTYTIGFTATDVNGNFAIDSFDVTIEDSLPPVILAQNVTVQLDAGGNATINIGMVNIGTFDNCGLDTMWIADTAFTCADLGANSVEFIAVDFLGNTDTVLFTVNVEDVQPPVVFAQNLTLSLNASGQAIINADSVNNNSNDNCSITALWLSDSIFDCGDTALFPTITLYAQDQSGNVDSATAVITVIDDMAPVVVTNNLSVLLDSFGLISIIPDDIDSNSTDNCAILTTWISRSNFDCSDVDNPVTDTLYVVDVSGNIDSGTAVVTVLDNIAPTLLAQNITIALDSFGSSLIDSSYVDLGSWDACGIQELWIEKELFSCADVGVNTLWYYGLDIHGNLDSISIDITVVDTIAPVIDIIDTFYVSLDSFGIATMTADSLDIGSWDSCGIASISIDTATFNCGNHGDTLTVTFIATDVNGNVSVDTSIFIINDAIAPTIFAHSDTFYLDSNGVFSFDAIGLNDSTQDACGVDTFYLSDTLVTCASVDSTMDIYFYAVDIYGNIDSQILNITALDTIHPVITCLDSIVQDNDIDECGAVVEFNWPTATDNCTVDSIVQIDTTGLDSNSFFPVGVTQLTYVAYDQSGNTDTCSFIIEVVDWQTPQLLCQSDTLTCDSTFIFTYPEYIDNCPGFDVVQVAGIASGEFYPVGSTINRFAVTDSYGNTDTCEYEVFRYDFPSLADAGPDQEKCEEYTGILAGNTPGVGFGFWHMLVGAASIADSTNPATTISGITVGTTSFEWRIENGVCPIERDTMEIVEYLNPTAANAGLDIILCDTTEGLLEAILDTIGTGTWLPSSNGTTISDTTAFNSVVTGLSLGSYDYVWKVVNGVCPITYDSVQIDVKPYTVVDAGKDRYIFNPSNIALTATSTLLPVTYTWSPASSLLATDGDSVMAAPRETMDFIVTAETEFGCKTRDTVMVGVNIGPVLPTAFTPDGDNYNDVWNLKELESYPGCEVTVYNRWGYEMFTSKGYKDSWDGTYKGEALPSGSYFYVIELNVEEVPPQTGSVTIIK